MFQAVIVFGVATIVFALSSWMWLSVLALAVLGAADTISVVIRFSLVQLATPDEMRGRVGAVNFLFINASNQLGQFESGVTAALFGAMPAAVLGGVCTVAVALLWMKLFPSCARWRVWSRGLSLPSLRAQRSNSPQGSLDCFAALAMTIVEAVRGLSRLHPLRAGRNSTRLLCMGLFSRFLFSPVRRTASWLP